VDPQISFVLASIASGLASICVVLSLWSFVRLSRLEANFATLDDKLPPKRIAQLEGAFDSLTNGFENMQRKNQEWKGSVHNSVQRLDNIMRRNEAASTALLADDGTLNQDQVAAPPPEGITVGVADEVELSKQAALRMRWNKNRGI